MVYTVIYQTKIAICIGRIQGITVPTIFFVRLQFKEKKEQNTLWYYIVLHKYLNYIRSFYILIHYYYYYYYSLSKYYLAIYHSEVKKLNEHLKRKKRTREEEEEADLRQ